jgi:hypothetical protein
MGLFPWMMLAIAALLLLSGCASIWPRDDPRSRVTVTGVLTFPAKEPPRLQECATRREVRLGEMTRGSYLYLRRRAREVATHQGKPVTAELSGYLVRAGGELRMDRVALHGLAPGRCRDMVDYGDIDS